MLEESGYGLVRRGQVEAVQHPAIVAHVFKGVGEKKYCEKKVIKSLRDILAVHTNRRA